MHNWGAFSPGVGKCHQHLCPTPGLELHRQSGCSPRECVCCVCPERHDFYVQRLGKNNTDDPEALLKRETTCLQHKVECLFRNCRTKAQTNRPDLQGQSMGSHRTGSMLTLHTANSEMPILPRDLWIWLFISHGSRASGRPREE